MADRGTRMLTRSLLADLGRRKQMYQNRESMLVAMFVIPAAFFLSATLNSAYTSVSSTLPPPVSRVLNNASPFVTVHGAVFNSRVTQVSRLEIRAQSHPLSQAQVAKYQDDLRWMIRHPRQDALPTQHPEPPLQISHFQRFIYRLSLGLPRADWPRMAAQYQHQWIQRQEYDNEIVYWVQGVSMLFAGLDGLYLVWIRRQQRIMQKTIRMVRAIPFV